METSIPRYLVMVVLLAAVDVIVVGLADVREIVVYGPPDVSASCIESSALCVKLLLT